MVMCIAPDQGAWKVDHDSQDRIFLVSKDSTHEVRMEISGIFGTLQNKEIYAKTFADWINERLEEDGHMTQCPCRICRNIIKKKQEI